MASSLQRALKPAIHILIKVFGSNIALLASFVTAVVYSSSYEPTGLYFFVIFVHMAAVKYAVKWYVCVFIFICLSSLSIMYFEYDFNNKYNTQNVLFY